jgi:hypothetical protein
MTVFADDRCGPSRDHTFVLFRLSKGAFCLDQLGNVGSLREIFPYLFGAKDIPKEGRVKDGGG